MDFGDALSRLKNGCKMTRKGWNGAGQYIELQTPDEHSRMGLPYLFISTVDGKLVPWVASSESGATSIFLKYSRVFSDKYHSFALFAP